jgi:hypothetical protein
MKLVERISPRRCAEWFVVANLAFLGVDIALAHAENAFRRRVEWAPIIFSGVATICLVPMAIGWRNKLWHHLEVVVGTGAVLVGVAGMALHLQSGFFQTQTLRNLVYSAPFVAPLAYVGVGLVLLMLRMAEATDPEMGWWLMLLALGGFAGNLGLSLLDHAQNGFFRWTEWVPVVAAAFGCSFLLVAWIWPPVSPVRLAWSLLAVQSVVGVLGFILHVWGDWHREAAHVTDRFLYGAPAFAPLLFADLAVLAAIGLWARGRSPQNVSYPTP